MNVQCESTPRRLSNFNVNSHMLVKNQKTWNWFQNPFLIFLNCLPLLFSVTSAIDNKSEKHEYHSISDNEDDDFFKPLDLGPSLMDEVFSELGSPNRLVQ